MSLLGKLFIPILFTGFTALFILNTYELSRLTVGFPYFVIAFVLLLSGALVIRESMDFARQNRRPGSRQSAATPESSQPSANGFARYRQPIGAVVLLSIYVLVSPRIGFYPATFIFLIVMCLVIGVPWRRMPVTAAVMALLTAASYGFFSILLEIPLP